MKIVHFYSKQDNTFYCKKKKSSKVSAHKQIVKQRILKNTAFKIIVAQQRKVLRLKILVLQIFIRENFT
jgi:hypothetical protein